jgi:integrase
MGKLTDRQILNAKPAAKDEFLSDGGGLYLRVRKSGSKFWLYRYKTGNTTKWIDIGVYPGVTLSVARSEAIRLKLIRDNGNDPVEHQKTLAASQAAAVEAIKQAQAKEDARLSVEQLLDRWERSELRNRKDNGAEIRRSFEKDVLPVIGNMAAADVKRGMIADLLDTVVERGAPIIARNLLSTLRQMFLFAIKRELVEVDPTAILKRDDYGKKIERSRVFTESEITELTNKISSANLKISTQLAIWIMLSTCSRVGEISRAKWEDIDFMAKTWRIPPNNSKNGKEHTIFLSEYSLTLFEKLRSTHSETQWCFPAENKKNQHVCVKSISKQIHDRQRLVPLKNRSKATGTLLLKGGSWTPHDLRRTGATIMGRLGTRPDVIEKCLNHAEQNKLVRIYQRQELIEEQREAWSALGSWLTTMKALPNLE